MPEFPTGDSGIRMYGHGLLLHLTAILAIALAASGVPASGQAPDTLHVLPSLTVSASRAAGDLETAAARVLVLDSLSLALEGRSTVADLLEARSGTAVLRYGPSGLASVRVRGATAGQTLVVLDGLPLSDPQVGQIDFSLLPAVMLESAEVRHGPASAHWGAGAVGSVVHLRSLTSENGRRLRVRSMLGAFGARRLSAVAAGGLGRTRSLVLLEGERADGDFPYLNTSRFPEEEERRRGADARRYGALWKIEQSRRVIDLALSTWYQEAERGLPGPAFGPGSGERQWDRQLRVWSRGSLDLRHGSVAVAGVLHVSGIRYVHPGLGIDDEGTVRSLSADLDAHQALGGSHLLDVGISIGAVRADHPSLSEQAGESRQSLSAALTSVAGPLTLYPAIRLDRYTIPGGRQQMPVSPSLGLNLSIVGPFRAKAAVARAFRMPTINDRYWVGSGNPNLEPEDGWSSEAGVAFRSSMAEFESTVFRSSIGNMIVWKPAGSIWLPENVQRVDAHGLETGGRFRIVGGGGRLVEVGSQYTLTDARPTGSGGDRSGSVVRYQPRHQLKVHGDVLRGSVGGGLSLQVVGRRYVTTDKSQWLDPYATVDGRLQWSRPLGKHHVQIRLVAKNLLDARYAIVRGYPMPPRHAEIHLNYDF